MTTTSVNVYENISILTVVDAAAPQGLRGMPDCSVEPFQLFWDPLTTDVQCITGYAVRYEIVETGQTFEETTQNTSIKVLDTKQLSTYNFIVAAKFPGGTGPFSESVVLKSGGKSISTYHIHTCHHYLYKW